MPWDDSKPLRIVFALVLWNVVFISCARRDCNNTNVTVPVPSLKYYLKGELHVSWTNERSGMWNYSVNYCCHVPTGIEGYCKQNCPNDYGKMVHCDKNFCSIISTQFVEYYVYLSMEYQGCQLKGDEEKLVPRVMNAHPDQVPNVEIISKNNRLVVNWPKSSVMDVTAGACYYVTCHEMEGSNKGKQVLHKPRHKTLTVSMWYGLSHYSSYRCCVKVHFCREEDTFGLFSEPVCKQIRTPAAAPSEPPEMLCGDERKCPTVVRNNLRDVTLLWKLPVNTTWNGILKEIILHVWGASESNVTEHVLNGTATEYTLKGLKMGIEYHVDLRLCTDGGCSPIDTPVVLRAELPDHTIAFFSSTVLIITSIAAVITILLLVACCIVDWRRTPHQPPVVELPILREPENVELPEAWSGESVATSIGANADYSVINAHGSRRFCKAPLDAISQGSNGSSCDTCSVDSSMSCSGIPLLSKNSRHSAEPMKRPWITTTNCPDHPARTDAILS